MLSESDHRCPDHHDCTVTIYRTDKAGEVGRRHLHQWIDPPGAWGRPDDHVVVGALNVGVLLHYNPATDEAVFDPERVVLTSSTDSNEAAARLNRQFPWANGHDGTKVVHPEHDGTLPPPVP